MLKTAMKQKLMSSGAMATFSTRLMACARGPVDAVRISFWIRKTRRVRIRTNPSASERFRAMAAVVAEDTADVVDVAEDTADVTEDTADVADVTDEIVAVVDVTDDTVLTVEVVTVAIMRLLQADKNSNKDRVRRLCLDSWIITHSPSDVKLKIALVAHFTHSHFPFPNPRSPVPNLQSSIFNLQSPAVSP